MRDDVMDVLLRMGMPASVKGTTYICDAMELFDSDPYYPEGKIGVLYSDIAKMHGIPASRVERAIRHAFETALKKGNQEIVEKYLDTANTQNSNLLRSLHFRIHQEERKRLEALDCSSRTCAFKKQIYREAVELLQEEYRSILLKLLESKGEETFLDTISR